MVVFGFGAAGVVALGLVGVAIGVAHRNHQESEQAEAAASTARHEAELAQRRAEYAKVAPAQREQGVRDCVNRDGCKQDVVDMIIASAPTPKERERLELVSFAVSAEKIAKLGQDGTEMTATPIAFVSKVVLDHPGVLNVMPKATPGEARKDTDSARGKVVSVSGTVVDIHKSGQLFTGTFVRDEGSAVYFVTPLPTAGIEDGSWATFKGVFVQEYAYANVSGGQTRSLLLVGGFNR
jgi:hypothetical protein